MKRLFILSFVLGFFPAYSQFRGGEGDGFASASLNLETVSVSSLNEENEIRKTIFKRGESLKVTTEVETGELVSLKGIINTVNVSEQEIELPTSLSSGLHVLVLRSSKGVSRHKIYVE